MRALAILALLTGVLPLRAQPELAETLRALDAQIAAEAAAIAALQEPGANASLKRLATELVTAAEEEATWRRQERALRAEVEALERELEAPRAAHADLLREAELAGEVLEIHAREVPGAGLVIPASGGTAEKLAALDALADLAGGVSMTEMELRTASGRKEAVTALRAGLIGLAYEAGGERRGLQLSAPREASGVRMVEGLAAEELAAAFEAARAGRPQIPFPLDPTGQLSPERARERGLMEQLSEGGPLMIPLLILLLAGLALGGERSVRVLARTGGQRGARRAVAAAEAGAPAPLPDRGDLAGVLRAVEGARGPVEERELVLDAALAALERGLSRGLGTLATVAAAAPLLGLLGTVTGIIRTFAALRATGGGDVSRLAGGISEALLTTAAGLIVAIPALLAHGLLSTRIERLLTTAEELGLRFLAATSPADEEETA